MGHKSSESPIRVRDSSRRRSPDRREKSPARHRSSQKASSPPREKPSSRAKSPSREKLRSPEKSPSPRTKRLKRAQAEREFEKVSEKEHKRNFNSDDERDAHRERVRDRQVPKEKDHGSRRTDRYVPNEKERDRNQNREDGKAAHRNNRDIDTQVPKEKEHGRNHHRERGSDRQVPNEKDRGRNYNREDERAIDDGDATRSRHRRSPSPSNRHHKSRHRSRSPHQESDKSEVTVSRGTEHRNGDTDSVAKMKAAEDALTTKEKQKPSFELSGKLAEETNRVRGITLLYNEPSEGKKPDIRWRLYVFKGGEMLNEPLYVHRQSYYLFGRERRVADIPTDHPSCSKQHAVLQYRQVEKEQPDGTMVKQVRPYVMDLGSTNGTYINDNRVEAQRYYELLERDTIKFGNSSREYVLLHENSAT